MSSVGFVKTLYGSCSHKIVTALCMHFDLRHEKNEFAVRCHTSFPYKFEDNILNEDGMEMVWHAEDDSLEIQKSIGSTHDNYVPLNEDDDAYL